jgi:hypothetical protein
MSTTAADLRSLSRANSRTTKSWAGIGSANIWRIDCIIPSEWEIHCTDPHAVAIVLQSFVVEVKLTGEEFQVTSSISNIYEFGETVSLALENYLALLVDELIWLEKHEPELSPAVCEDLRLLRSYIRIV